MAPKQKPLAPGQRTLMSFFGGAAAKPPDSATAHTLPSRTVSAKPSASEGVEVLANDGPPPLPPAPLDPSPPPPAESTRPPAKEDPFVAFESFRFTRGKAPAVQPEPEPAPGPAPIPEPGPAPVASAADLPVPHLFEDAAMDVAADGLGDALSPGSPVKATAEEEEGEENGALPTASRPPPPAVVPIRSAPPAAIAKQEEEEEMIVEDQKEEKDDDEEEEEDEDEDGPTEYEKRRLAIMQRNALKMQELLGDELGAVREGRKRPTPAAAAAAHSKKHAHKKKKTALAPPPSGELRRSGRHAGLPAQCLNEDQLFERGGAAGTAAAPESAARHPAPRFTEACALIEYDDSDVVRYACDAATHARAPSAAIGLGFGPSTSTADAADAVSGRGSDAELRGFRTLPCSLADAATKPFYSIDYDGAFIAAGGQSGQFALWAVQDVTVAMAAAGAPEAGDGDVAPLISCKLQSGWIADVRLVRAAPSAAAATSIAPAVLLLSASNNGHVCVWDLGKQHRGVPAKVFEARDLHSNGIFSMDVWEGRHVLTASKDRSAVLSTLAADGRVTCVHRWSDLHDGGVVKSCQFRDAATAGTAGDDATVAILDLRSKSISSRIETAFPSEVSCVVFSPTDPHLLLTTSKDPVLKVWDLRNPAKPVHAFQGHTRQAKPNMYRAVFCGGGRYIASPGAGSEKLSLYRLADGKTVSRGDLGFDPSTVLVPGGGRGAEGSLLLGGKGRVVLAEPVWE